MLLCEFGWYCVVCVVYVLLFGVFCMFGSVCVLVVVGGNSVVSMLIVCVVVLW